MNGVKRNIVSYVTEKCNVCYELWLESLLKQSVLRGDD